MKLEELELGGEGSTVEGRAVTLGSAPAGRQRRLAGRTRLHARSTGVGESESVSAGARWDGRRHIDRS